ncbi:hypothetical protein PT974_08948 [Cladobotryum mycophilum]|uniref:Extracellular matrix protein n=1 Tax=Cladobotryum mycophilum TaxID=491253 RepID=A0ABR0SFC6_9HYPO
MKYSIATLSALAAVVLAKPEFLNSSFHVEEGQPFTLKFAGCETGCTILLQDGPSSNLRTVKTLSTSATGASLTVTLDDLPAGTYNFKITDASGQSNYSAQFVYQGTGTITTTGTATGTATTTGAVTSTTAATTLTKVTSTTATETTETSTSATSTSTKVTSTTATSTATTTTKASTTSAPITTSAASTTTSHETSSTSTTTRAAVTTTPPGSSAGRLSSPIALVAGVVMAIAYFS